MDTKQACMIIEAVHDNLAGAEVIAMMPSERESITRGATHRDGEPDQIAYWERAWIVAWKRPVREHQMSPEGDGHTYATHRVHVNSLGEASCFMGHYDQRRDAALWDMVERSGMMERREGFARSLGQSSDNPADSTWTRVSYQEDADA